MPTISFSPHYGSLSIQSDNNERSIHLITAIAKLARCSHRISDFSNGDQVGVEIELLMQSEIEAGDRERVGFGYVAWLSSAEGSASAYGPHTISVTAYMHESAFNFSWSRFLTNDLSGFRIIIELEDEPRDIHAPWTYKLNHDYPIRHIRVENVFGSESVG